MAAKRETIRMDGFGTTGRVARTADGVAVELGPIGEGKIVVRATLDVATAEDLGQRLLDAARRDPPAPARHATPAAEKGGE